MNSLETNIILYNILKGIHNISGGVYNAMRPADSVKEDIVVNNLFINYEMPQSGVSNVNIHVPDVLISVGGKDSAMPDSKRLRVLTEEVKTTLKAAKHKGLHYWIAQETSIKGQKEHYINLRINWNIHLKD